MKDTLKKVIGAAFPSALITIGDETKKGFWVDISLNGQLSCVEYREGEGFGISNTATAGYGMGHDMVVTEIDSVVGCLEQILGTQKPA